MNKQPAWLKNAIFYQIYPQSFRDSNGDGIGDLRGIIEKLDYVKSIGCNAIWLNPVFESPFADAGYDVTDFRKVAPRYGSNEDLMLLFEEAHRRDMRVVLDIVAGHTSIHHPWFQESMRHDQNAYSDRYLWIEPVWRPSPPELNHISGFSDRNASYITNFFWCQPALNYGYADPDPENPWELSVDHPTCQAMLAELNEIMDFWMHLGADGFRVDMAQSLIRGHDPVRRKEALERLWREIRGKFDEVYPEAVLIAEWSFPKHAISAGFHLDFMIHMETIAYNALFRNHRKELVTCLPRGESYFHRKGSGSILDFLDPFLEHLAVVRGQGFISIPTGNHDIPPRLAEDRSPEELKCAFLFLLTLPGVPFIYYGDEIGMRSGRGPAVQRRRL